MLKVAAEGDDASVSALDLWSAMMKVGDAAATTTSSGGGGGGGGGAGGGAGAGGGGGGGDATSSSWSTLLSDGLHLSVAGATTMRRCRTLGYMYWLASSPLWRCMNVIVRTLRFAGSTPFQLIQAATSGPPQHAIASLPPGPRDTGCARGLLATPDWLLEGSSPSQRPLDSSRHCRPAHWGLVRVHPGLGGRGLARTTYRT